MYRQTEPPATGCFDCDPMSKQHGPKLVSGPLGLDKEWALLLNFFGIVFPRRRRRCPILLVSFPSCLALIRARVGACCHGTACFFFFPPQRQDHQSRGLSEHLMSGRDAELRKWRTDRRRETPQRKPPPPVERQILLLDTTMDTPPLLVHRAPPVPPPTPWMRRILMSPYQLYRISVRSVALKCICISDRSIHDGWLVSSTVNKPPIPQYAPHVPSGLCARWSPESPLGVWAGRPGASDYA